MAAEVNKLIGGKLLSGESIYLPEVGSLYIVVNASQKKKVEFSSNEQGTPLIGIIEERAKCTSDQALEIYNRWLAEVRKEQALYIEGVGELRGKSFVGNRQFLNQLNPELYREVKQESNNKKSNKKGGMLPIVVAIILLLLIAVGYFIFTSVKASKQEKARIEAIARTKAMEQQRIADSVNLAEIEARRAQELLESESATTLGARYKVVYGVFELRSNVDNAIKNIPKIAGSHPAKEYPLGTKTMVSMFESDDRQECQRFLMANYDNFPDTWIYDSQQ